MEVDTRPTRQAAIARGGVRGKNSRAFRLQFSVRGLLLAIALLAPALAWFGVVVMPRWEAERQAQRDVERSRIEEDFYRVRNRKSEARSRAGFYPTAADVYEMAVFDAELDRLRQEYEALGK
jgi:hypothetical protein